MTGRILIAAACALTLSACVHERVLPPPPGADLAPGDFHAADLTPLDSFRRLSPQPFALVRGKTACRVVTADDPRCTAAALELADVIRRMTGVKPDVLRVLDGQVPPEGPALFVGNAVAATDRAAAPDGCPDAFRVVAADGSVRFLGRADFAVYDWCERQLGVRCYGPDDADFIVPRSDGLSVLAVDYRDRPVFAHRDFGGYGRARWGRFAKTGRSARPFPRVHAPAKWHADAALVAAHPGIFARAADGGRAGTPMLCYGNPETLAYYKERIDAHIAGRRDSGGIVDPATKTITVSAWDAFVDCTCTHCRPLLDPAAGADGYASRVLWGRFLPRLARWAAEAHPEYTVAFLPYWNACAVPRGLNLRRFGNCEATVCVMPGLALLKNKETRVREEERIRDWRRATGYRPLLWHYSCWPAEYTAAPYVYGETIRRHFRSLRGDIDGAFVCCGNDLPRHALSLYVWMRCLWNPELDVQAVYDGYARRLFGLAAEPVRDLIRRLERGWSRDWPDERLVDANVFGISYPPVEVHALRALLDEATRRAAGDAAVTARLGRMTRGFAAFFRRAEAYEKGARRPLVGIARAAAAPVIDGRLDDACWKGASARDFVSAFRSRAPRYPTRAAAVWTDAGVTFGLRCTEPATDGLRRGAAQGDFLRQDTVSVLFDATGTDDGVCRHLMLDASGRLSAFADTLPWTADGARGAVHIGDGEWSAEIFVPFAALADVDPPHPGAVWRFNLVRGRVGDTWKPEGERAEESRPELSRLSTMFSPLNTDRDAFLPCVFAE